MNSLLARSKWALYHELYIQWRRVILSALAVSGTAMLVSLLSWIGGNPASPEMLEQYPIFLVAWGAIMVSGVFAELREEPLRMEFLLRPAGAAEKVLAKLLVSTLYYFVAFTAIFFGLSGILRIIYAAVYSAPSPVNVAVPQLLWGVFRAYLLVHSWFFFGAVYFRNHNAFKTLLVVAGVGLSYVLLTAGFGRLLLDSYISGPQGAMLEQRFGEPSEFSDIPQSLRSTLKAFEWIGKGIVTVSVPGFWLLSWRRLKETEA